MNPRGNITLNLLSTVSAMILVVNDIIAMPVALAIVALAAMNQFLKSEEAERAPVRIHTKVRAHQKYD